MKVGITGKQGHLGARIAAKLQAQGHAVVRLTDVFDEGLLAGQLQGVEAVVDTMSGFKAGGFPRPESQKIESKGHRILIAACQKHKVEHFVFVSVIGAPKATVALPHFYEKAVAEEFLKTQASEGFRVTVLRPGMFLDQVDGRIEKGLEKGKYECIGSADVAFAVTSTPQVVEAVVCALHSQSKENFRVFDICAANATPKELTAAFSQVLQKPIALKPLPFGVFAILTAIPSLFEPGLKNLKEMMRFFLQGKYEGKCEDGQRLGLGKKSLEDLIRDTMTRSV
jgi:nucleoside-diphosphate-sugar epimerase